MLSANFSITSQFVGRASHLSGSARDLRGRDALVTGETPAPLAPVRRTPRLHFAEYRQLVREIRKVAKAAIPANSTVAVISKGDHQLLKLGSRTAWHFPQEPNGSYTGHHPADSGEAIAKLEAARAAGAQFLLLPATAFWWLEFYQDFSRHLTDCYRVVLDKPDTCLIYQRSERDSGAGARILIRSSAKMLRCLWRSFSLSPVGRCCGLKSALRADTETLSRSDGFRVALDSEVPRKLVVGEGTAIYVSGWCYHQHQELLSVELLGNGPAEPVKSWRFPRPDVYAAHHPHTDPAGRSYHSGFGGMIVFSKVTEATEVPIVLRARLRSGVVIESELTRVILEPRHGSSITQKTRSDKSSQSGRALPPHPGPLPQGEGRGEGEARVQIDSICQSVFFG